MKKTGTAIAVVPAPKASTALATRVESKAEKFVRLANIRAGAAIEAIERLGKLGTHEYEYSSEQVARLSKALREAVGVAMVRLETRARRPRQNRDVL